MSQIKSVGYIGMGIMGSAMASHSGRRTFITLKFLAGMPAQAIMVFSGHSTERSFLKYLKLDAELVANQYADYF